MNKRTMVQKCACLRKNIGNYEYLWAFSFSRGRGDQKLLVLVPYPISCLFPCFFPSYVVMCFKSKPLFFFHFFMELVIVFGVRRVLSNHQHPFLSSPPFFQASMIL
jgi:hypothetical protein